MKWRTGKVYTTYGDTPVDTLIEHFESGFGVARVETNFDAAEAAIGEGLVHVHD